MTENNLASSLTHGSWSPLQRAAFRFACLYFFIYCLFNGNANLWSVFPVFGGTTARLLERAFLLPAQWIAQHHFHLTGTAAHIHSSGSGDTAIQWIAQAVMLLAAFLGALLWSLLDPRRPHYQTLSAWLRFLIRLTLGIGMIIYGLSKLLPLQMPPPSIAVLNEPLGQSSPMTLLWTLLGLNPAYEMVCGAAELTAGALILFRRTALAGALLTAFVMSNVVLYNFFFDVPVKLYSANLLLMATFVILPDARPLFDFFWHHRPAAPTGIWVPPARRLAFRRATAIIEIAVTSIVLGGSLFGLVPAYRQQLASQRNPSPLAGAWHITSASAPIPTGDGLPATDLYLETTGRAFVRDSSGALWRSGIKPDPATHTLTLRVTPAGPITYTYTQPDPLHLLLTPADPKLKSPTLTLLRTPTPATYPLLTRGFHLVNEWGLER